jgi:DNA-binding response OmpR family regulator
MRVLVAEDDEALRSVLERGLRESGYVVDAVPDGATALRFLRTYEYEVAVLDWRMPVTSGVEVLRQLRHGGSHLPVLMLTARDTVQDRITGLDEGADDYLVKPFDFSELLARMRALQRRPPVAQQPVLSVGDLALDPATHEVTVTGRSLALTTTEFSLLELLVRRANTVVGRRAIAVHVWDQEADAVGSNTIDVHVARLRAKLAGTGVRIDTVRGVGYRIMTA